MRIAEETRAYHVGGHAPPGLRERLGGHLRHDLPASFVVFLVAVPLSLGIAVASDAPLVAGLIAAAVGGMLAALFGGSMVQVSGPAAGLTIIVAELVAAHGWATTCLITALAGVVQILLGALRIARAALAVSPAVVHGMLAGVGVTITLAQIHVVLGGAAESSPIVNLRELPGQLLHNHTASVAVGLVTVALLLAWGRMPLLPWLPLRRVPGPLAAITAATAVSLAFDLDVERVSLPALSEGLGLAPTLPEGNYAGVAAGVATIALVASVESLLCAVAVDRLHDGRRARLDRELVGQGAANTVSGLLGGLPVAGVIVRSTTNVQAGARTPVSAFLHGAWILLFVITLSSIIEFIPMAALAGLLVFTGMKMVDIAHIRGLRAHRERHVYIVTLLSVVFLGLVEGVIIGLVLAFVAALRRLTRTTVRTRSVGRRHHVVIEGSLTFLAVPRVSGVLSKIPPGTDVDLDLHVDFMDNAAFDAIHSWRVAHERGGGRVDIDELHEDWYEGGVSGSLPNRKTPVPPMRHWLRPRGHGRAPEAGTADSSTSLLLSGARDYHMAVAPRLRPVMAELSTAQRPHTLLIACADSRIVPNLFTASGPGDLFTIRNVGNIVPAYRAGEAEAGTLGTLEYAIGVLGVRSIAVCGHSRCGAAEAVLKDPEAVSPGVRTWLALGGCQAGSQPVAPGETHEAAWNRASRGNVVRQLDNLMTYPLVRGRVAAGELELVGLYYDILTAQVHVLDRESGLFLPAGEGPVGVGAEGGPARPAPPAGSDPAASPETDAGSHPPAGVGEH
ncbi:bifunctional SulP family inorganic anion transporter/carbonic anhydrase [Marinactinospora thermotolerans]|uniref:carbonic anhydrase n=1 Tax=Marinactinospora thermotolerans DSM 45154 TaxID=1122192 RepID=A0A1T4T2E4_9ACTN|nr:bifunctional SulP family inorganic anion transporter/carbonic anhydrase [Marinactinospora thermotolerans]SKA34700.1 carbonic anhydrase [Marinactinospora thermotolerans DSM 45154]